ncbi:hypothetical protein CVT24_004933 [Panaeolus cyanescens]|uniref:PABS domain-containing protein n=1 Tax=Panaeolus cyanescens TaxID=181874 RepID=A0A409V9L2_9AGAR|nr:hypothetical protein CVT24_004933 [Panaeolus cyanescens]
MSSSTVWLLLKAIPVVVALSLVIFTYERELVPLYGSGPTNYLLNKIGFVSAFLSSIQPFSVHISYSLFLTAIALTIAPNATYWTAVWTSHMGHPLWGPAIAHVTVLAPLVSLLIGVLGWPNSKFTVALPTRALTGAAVYSLSYNLHRRVWAPSSLFYDVSDSNIYLNVALLTWGAFILTLSFSKSQPAPTSKKTRPQKAGFTDRQIKGVLLSAFAAVWRTVQPHLVNPVLPHPLPEVFTHPSYPLQILSAEQSVTGLITVGQWLPPPKDSDSTDQLHSARYLRASHSVLGGVWTHDKVQKLDDDKPLEDIYGAPLGDSIYSTFVIQEAARLVNSTKASKAGKVDNALVIGLGIGTSATSFMRHGINTTIVEIDPAVYRAARTWFALPDPGPNNVYLEDARSWALQKKLSIDAGNKEPLYDIVVHDCFSGGGVPEHIYTFEFWNDLKSSMQKEGIIAVNFAGVLSSLSSRLVVSTLEKAFGQCRAFHDMFDEFPEEKYATEFINMVIFCSQSPAPLTFRNSKRSDWLGSPLRRHVLQSLNDREVNLSLIRETPGDERYIITDNNNPLGPLQEQQGAHHWEGESSLLRSTSHHDSHF